MLDPYDGKVKSIFLDDDQEPLSRKGGVATLTNHLIGKPSGLGNFRAKLHPKFKGISGRAGRRFPSSYEDA